jgi:hypothetical protein
MLHAVQLDRCARDLGELRWRLLDDRRATRERLPDRTELAGLRAVAIAHALLQERAREHVGRVQRRDLPVRHAVGRAAPVEARHGGDFDRQERLLTAVERGLAAELTAHRERRADRRPGVDRHHDHLAGELDRLVIGRPGTALATEPHASAGKPAHAARLQLGHELKQRGAVESGLCRFPDG